MNPKTRNKIKVAYVMPSLDKGGAERFLTDLILNLDKEKFDPVLVLFKWGGEWAAELEAKKIPVVILPKKGKIDPFNFWRLLGFLREFQPQIVHTQLGGDVYGRLAAKLLRIPVVVTTEQNVNPDEKLSYHLAKRITARWADKIVAISRAVRDDLIARYSTPERQIMVIPNGIEVKNFLKTITASGPGRDNQGITSRPTVIGTIGRLAPQKGQAILIDALARLKDKNFDCLIAGAGPLRGELEKQIKAVGLEERVKLIGLVSDSAAFLNSLDIFVLPSLWEGLGLVILEAGLGGRPIIASAVDGIKEIIDEDTGWLVAPGDSVVLAAKIDWLLANRDSALVRAKAERLQAKIMAKFDIKKIAADYQKLYCDLLSSKGYEDITSK